MIDPKVDPEHVLDESDPRAVVGVHGQEVSDPKRRRDGFDLDRGGRPGQIEHPGHVDAVVAVGADTVERAGPAGGHHQDDLGREQLDGESIHCGTRRMSWYATVPSRTDTRA